LTVASSAQRAAIPAAATTKGRGEDIEANGTGSRVALQVTARR
jgi:hypothetical protein